MFHGLPMLADEEFASLNLDGVLSRNMENETRSDAEDSEEERDYQRLQQLRDILESSSDVELEFYPAVPCLEKTARRTAAKSRKKVHFAPGEEAKWFVQLQHYAQDPEQMFTPRNHEETTPPGLRDSQGRRILQENGENGSDGESEEKSTVLEQNGVADSSPGSEQDCEQPLPNQALLNPLATLSLVISTVAERFKDHLTGYDMYVRTITGQLKKSLGMLGCCTEIDGHNKALNFRVIPEMQLEILLGMDFCRKFDCDARLGRGVWRVLEGNWNAFENSQEGKLTKIRAVCAGISVVEDQQREEIKKMMREMLTNITSSRWMRLRSSSKLVR